MNPPKQFSTLSQLIQQINLINPYIIGICGVPGAGKSSISNELHKKLQNSVIVQMDGYHIYRKDLTEEGLKKRGAMWTFDMEKFKKDVMRLKQNRMRLIQLQSQQSQQSQQMNRIQQSQQLNRIQQRQQLFPLYFPSFSHSLKDPIQHSISIKYCNSPIIIQGLYIFDKSLNFPIQFYDMKIFIQIQQQECMNRLIKRCINEKIEDNMEKTIQRVVGSDMVNGKYVKENTDFGMCSYMKNQGRVAQG